MRCRSANHRVAAPENGDEQVWRNVVVGLAVSGKAGRQSGSNSMQMRFGRWGFRTKGEMLLASYSMPLFFKQISLWKNFSTIGQRSSSSAC